MSTDVRLVRVSARTYRIRNSRSKPTTAATKAATRFARKEPDAAQDYPPSRFVGWMQRVPREDRREPTA